MQSDMRIDFFDIEICAKKELFIIIIIIYPTRRLLYRRSVQSGPNVVGKSGSTPP